MCCVNLSVFVAFLLRFFWRFKVCRALKVRLRQRQGSLGLSVSTLARERVQERASATPRRARLALGAQGQGVGCDLRLKVCVLSRLPFSSAGLPSSDSRKTQISTISTFAGTATHFRVGRRIIPWTNSLLPLYTLGLRIQVLRLYENCNRRLLLKRYSSRYRIQFHLPCIWTWRQSPSTIRSRHMDVATRKIYRGNLRHSV